MAARRRKLDTFTVRDLRERTGQLIRDAEAGRLAVVTKRGRPVFVAVPLDEHLLTEGARLALAIKLYEEEVVSLGKGARLAGLSVASFIDRLGALGIAAVRHSPAELADELAAKD